MEEDYREVAGIPHAGPQIMDSKAADHDTEGLKRHAI